MADYEEHLQELSELGVSIFAASADTGNEGVELAKTVSFPVGEGVTAAQAESLGAWWETRRGIIQPSQFLIRNDGMIVQSTYSDGPLGRINAADVCGLVKFLQSQ